MKITRVAIEGYEEVWKAVDGASSFLGYIAVHSTTRGPALGGIRMHNYLNEKDALEDVLKLAKAMTYKAAGANLKLGGGKAVIVGNPKADKTEALFLSMAKFINHVEGRYLAAKDAGIVTEDLVEIAKDTKFITGLPTEQGGSGDPSPWTAVGIMAGLKACTQYYLSDKKMNELSVGIQGIGHVGSDLVKLLLNSGAKVHLSDISVDRLAPFEDIEDVKVIPASDWAKQDVDVLSPCALGGVINEANINDLKCKVIAGGANNQLLNESADAKQLKRRQILYAPDYILNAGGLINIYVKDILHETDTLAWINKIPDSLQQIFNEADSNNRTTVEAAEDLVKDRLINPHDS